MLMDVVFVLIFILLLMAFVILVIKDFNDLTKTVITKSKAEKVKNKISPVNIELIDIFLIEKHTTKELDKDVHYVVKDTESNKLYCLLGETYSGYDSGFERSSYNTNISFYQIRESIKEDKKVIGFNYDANIINLDSREELNINDKGKLWNIESAIPNSLTELVNDEEALEKIYKNNIKYKYYYDKKNKNTDKLLNLNPKNDYTILKQCEFISGIVEFK